MIRPFLFALLALVWAAPAGAAIAYVSSGGYGSGASGATSVALTAPTGLVSGELEIAFVTIQDNKGTSTVATLSGWTPITSVSGFDSGAATGLVQYAFWKVAGVSEPATYTFTGTAGSGATVTGMDGVIVAFSGTATTSPINSFASKYQAPATHTVTVPALSETFVSGEWYVGNSIDPLNNLPTASPTLSNTYSNAGSYESYYTGSYAPGSTPGTEVYTYGLNNYGQSAIGFTILPPSVGPTSCPLTRTKTGVGC
jgi:hypothetical protein